MKTRRLCALMLVAVLWICTCLPVDAATPKYTIASSVSTQLTFSGTTAHCSISAVARQLSTSISGTLELHDNTANLTAARWTFSDNGLLSEFRNATVTKGHSYTLSFSGIMVDGNISEPISASTTKTCPKK